MTTATIVAAECGEYTGEPAEHRFRFTSDSAAAPAARAALRDLESAVPPGLLTDLMLCVTELVTNSVQHPVAPEADEVEVLVRVAGDVVRVEGGDSGPRFEQSGVHKERGEGGGWGLYIVDLLPDRWGVDRGDSTRVWLEIDLGGSGARP